MRQLPGDCSPSSLSFLPTCPGLPHTAQTNAREYMYDTGWWAHPLFDRFGGRPDGPHTRLLSVARRNGRSASTLETVSRDAQAAAPATRVSLSRVGVTGVEKVIRVCAARRQRSRRANLDAGLYHAELECFVDLNPEQAGVHMSRFEEVVNEAIDEVVLGESLRAEGLAAHIAERVRERQGGLRAEVRIAARYPETVPAPVSGIPTQEIYTLFGTAVASERGTRTLTGVEAQGMTACPCAQGLVEDGARERLAEPRLRRRRRSTTIVETVPIATHNQRGIGTPLHRPPRGLRRRHRRPRPAAHRRVIDVERDLRADEARRRARRRREGPRQPPLRRGLRPRDDPPASPSAYPDLAPEAPSSRPARRTWRRSTATTSSPSATA